MDSLGYLWLIPVMPLAGAVFNGIFAYRAPRRLISWVGCGTVGVAFFVAITGFIALAGLPESSRVISDHFYTWIVAGNFSVDFNFYLDPLSAVMALVVTGVGFLIHIYSMGYMHDDPGYGKYFSFLNLFIFSMTVLILSDNLVGLFLGWEGVGLCSYLLIGFWYEDNEKAEAGKKAFIVNRIGDAGFIFGIAILFWYFGTTRIPQLAEMIRSQSAPIELGIITIACISLFIGATGKSAQLPLYVWLPDAMAGPTPVSALIHAATMVTAGVYMVARMNFLYDLSPVAMGIVAGVGVLTAIWAAMIAFTQNDIKRVLAYSTISQLGYMFVGVGVGAYTAGIFHLMTHAFFKACLFLGSGAVIHYLHGEQDIRRMGGLRHMPGMKAVFYGWVAATLAISGLPFVTSGFFSKDEILWMALASNRGAVWIYGIGAITAVFTGLYMWRLTVLTFFGESRVDKHTVEHPHKPSFSMWGVVAMLGFLSIIGGWIGIPAFLGERLHIPNFFEHWLAPVFESSHVGFRASIGGAHALHSLEMRTFVLGLIIPLVGIGLGLYLWTSQRALLANLARKGITSLFYRASLAKFYVDEIYDAVVVQPIKQLSVWVFWQGVDVRVIDFTVNLVARVTTLTGDVVRYVQTGNVQFYAFSMFAGLAVIIWVIVSVLR
jgi:NADH-quinone oxidoreductase subunit L